MLSETIAKFDHTLRPLFLGTLPNWMVIKLYSSGRNSFIKILCSEKPTPWSPTPQLARTLWGIKFRTPLFNAAGMFKNGEGYDLVARQGAGAYLAGTSTESPRYGNKKIGICAPFIPYPRSGAASNWLGLPNPGHTALAHRLSTIQKVEGCPVGISLTGDPATQDSALKLQEIVNAMHKFSASGVDFIELNESCPNTEHGRPQESDLKQRLEFIKANFIDKRPRNIPVIVKFSIDTAIAQIPDLVSLLINLKFDGINLGNTSTNYSACLDQLDPTERSLFNYFSSKFGGGVSGKPLKDSAIKLVGAAKEALTKLKPNFEFHIIGTGGAANLNDVEQLLAAGASLIQWYTGYFESFAIHGHRLYQAIFSK